MAPKGLLGGLGSDTAKEIAGRLRLIKEMWLGPTGCAVKCAIVAGIIYVLSPVDFNMMPGSNWIDDTVAVFFVAYLIPELFLTPALHEQLLIRSGLKEPEPLEED